MPDTEWLWLIGVAAALFAVFMVGGIYGIFIEPSRLAVTRREIASAWLPAGFDGIKIVQISDTHVGPDYTTASLSKLIDAVNAEMPDIVAFTGDLFDARRRNPERERDLSPLLSRIEAPLGKFAVYGNHDFGYERTKRSTNPSLARAGFDLLLNETRKIRLPGGEHLSVSGLDDYVLGRPDPVRTLAKLRPDGFNLLLVHEPDVAASLARYPIDLQLSGHSHGGQVKLPIVGALVRTQLGKRYLSGLHVVSDRRRPRRPYLLYVNRGIGTTRLRVRFGSVPELSVFTLRREARRDSSIQPSGPLDEGSPR
ncbi:metallophosphoesterase [Cohnella sp. JJ-181]|uniref:metallophosphoesterase n=1 Tax=Cohnella rhizoplanae TaxID=2974897 RepID=UPI0022FF6B59|nr:metallophosphoesterase [Cohnella sp. JJ-181]CAI6053432.1 UDP-2,3-diacylglucosamine pyrophosphatase LpxG [Cohnella sp. JJ-181]